jgi:hypothetical protein
VRRIRLSGAVNFHGGRQQQQRLRGLQQLAATRKRCAGGRSPELPRAPRSVATASVRAGNARREARLRTPSRLLRAAARRSEHGARTARDKFEIHVTP